MNIKFLKALTETFSVSGYEEESTKLFGEYLKDIAVISCDALGNTYAHIKTDDFAKSIMIEAHIDENGFAVTYIDSSGYLFIRQIGGIDWGVVPGSIVNVKTISGEILYGVIGKMPIHVQRPEDKNNAPKSDGLFVDLGLSYEEVSKKVTIGDPVGFVSNFLQLGDNVIASKGLDDKVGIAIIAEVIRKIHSEGIKANVCAVATTQEEVGTKGAKIVTKNFHPDYSISIDVDHATDIDYIPKKRFGDIALGRGVIIARHTDQCRRLVNMAIQKAKSLNIAFQISAYGRSSGGTNTPSIQTSEGGISTLLLGIPNRYMHTQVEMCDMRDLQAASDLIVALIKELG